MVGRNVLGMYLVGQCLLENISDLLVFRIMYMPLCICLSMRCIYVCMFAGYLLCMAYFSFLGWFSMFLLISCVQSMFLYARE
jgi:hypothetical protein